MVTTPYEILGVKENATFDNSSFNMQHNIH